VQRLRRPRNEQGKVSVAMPETNKFDTTNILVVGTGGQGVMTATEILAEAAIALGHDVKKTEVAGMAQRGGVVSSHLRFGTKSTIAADHAGFRRCTARFRGRRSDALAAHAASPTGWS
jgi:hypothetical protein